MDDPWSSSPWGAQPTESKPSDALPSWDSPSQASKAQPADDGWGASSSAAGAGWGDGNLDGGWGESVQLHVDEPASHVCPVEIDDQDELEEARSDEQPNEASSQEEDVDLTSGRQSHQQPSPSGSHIGSDGQHRTSQSAPGSPSTRSETVGELADMSASPLPPTSPRAFLDNGFGSPPQIAVFPSPSPPQHSLPLPTSDSFASFPSSPPPNTFPSSPSFDGGDFGGFSSPQMLAPQADDDDPWGRGAQAEEDGGWEPSGVAAGPADDGLEWGQATEDTNEEAPGQSASTGGKVDEWEEARRLAAKRQAKAPTHVLSEISRQWSTLSTSLFPDPSPPAQEGEKAAPAASNELDQHLSKSLLEITQRSLDVLLPPNLPSASTHQLFKVTVTARRFQDTLNRTNHLSSSSILSSSNRRRPTALLSPEPARDEARSDWWGVERSMLGEPEGGAPKEEIVVPKRSFWSRKSSTMSISGVASVAGAKVGGSSDLVTSPVVASGSPQPSQTPPIGTSSPRVSTSSARPSIEITGPSSSRPTTPRPASPAPPLQSEAPAAPSGVSRFFGRWSRKPTSLATSVTNADGSPKELELSGNDFDFLEEVQGPAVTRSGGGNLMGDDEEGGLDGFDGLDGFLAMDQKQEDRYSTPLPQKLEPPPMQGSRPPSTAPRAPATAPAPPAVFNELDFLDFGGSSSRPTHTAPAAAPSAPAGSSSFDMWDDFMAAPSSTAPSASISRTTTPTIIPRLPSPLPPPAPAPLAHVRASTAPSIAPLAPPPTARPSSTSPLANGASSSSFSFSSPPPTAKPAAASSIFDDEDDFGDFDSAPAASTSTFTPTLPSSTSFGDFSAPSPSGSSNMFASLSQPHPTHTPTTIRTSDLSQPYTHTPTTSSALSEPPTPPTKSPRHAIPGAFSPAPPPVPKLAFPPPPGSGSSSRTGAGGTTDLSASNVGDEMKEKMGGLVAHAGETKGARWPGPVSPGIPLVPGPAQGLGWGGEGAGMFGEENNTDTATTPKQVVPEAPKVHGGAGGGGLSAQDLSFFDSL